MLMLMLLLYTALRLIFFRFRVCFGVLSAAPNSRWGSSPPILIVIGELFILALTAAGGGVSVDEDVWDPSLFAVTDSVELAESPEDIGDVATSAGDANDAEIDGNNDVVWDAGLPGDVRE
jgi:hypothetical protein